MTKLKVYFTSSNLDHKILEKIDKKITLFLKNHSLFLTNILLKDKKKTAKEIFSIKKKLIEEADLVVAEVSNPSTAVGGEVVYALVKEKPLLALFYKDTQDKLSPMIKGNPSENLYLEYYDQDNLSLKLKSFLTFVKNLKKRKGKLIIIEGGDGSGKATQGKLLVDYLQKKGWPVKYYDFPRYYSSFHGRFIGRFLAGEFGSLDSISPYFASLAYALDRVSVKKEMEDWLNKGGIIICNRYVTSSMAHQSARLPAEKREEFINWIDELEYRQHKMPRPDLVIYLYVPWEIGLKLTQKKAKKRDYIKGLDLAEKDINHRIETEKNYLQLVKKQKNWVKIDCLKERKLLSIKEINKKIREVLYSKLKIN